MKRTNGRAIGWRIWRRSRWKYCAGVVALQTCMLSSAQSWRYRSRRALECSGPWPSEPCGSSIPMRVVCRHLSSAEAMNWSMMTCAPLAKSPNWASQSTSASGHSTL